MISGFYAEGTINHAIRFAGKDIKEMKITKDTIIGDILDNYPDTAPLFFEIGMHCLGCPHSRGESVGEACEVHGTDVDELVAKLNEAISK